jgi:serine/threonine protein kinase
MMCPQCQSENDNAAASCFTCGHPLLTLANIRKGSIIGGRYEILSPLGKGGMGMVFKAHDQVLEEVVALKLLRSDVVAGAPDLARRFRQEIRLARRVRHRNVCGIHEYGEEGGLRYIAMELIEGVDLRHVLDENGPPPPEEAFEISLQICEGLQAIHEAGIIHRDLKAPNIMRDAKGHVRLMDFGIAKEAGSGSGATMGATALGMIIGTPEYMSPEQARGEKVDFRSDIYALGVLIFEIFTGQLPFQGETPLQTLFKQMQDPPPLDDPQFHLPQLLVPVLRKALAKNRDDRHKTCRELAQDLQRAGGETFPPAARLPPLPASRSATARALQPATEESTPVPTAVPTDVRTAVRTGVQAAPEFETDSLAAPSQPSAEEVARAERQAWASKIEGLLASGDLDGAEASLAEAREAMADGEPLVDLGGRLHELRRRQALEAAVQEWLAAGEQFAATQRYGEALDALRQAAQLDPGNHKAQSLILRTEQELRRWSEEQQRAKALAEGAAAVQALLERGALAEASAEIGRLERGHPNAEPLTALRQRLQEQQEEERRRQKELQQREREQPRERQEEPWQREEPRPLPTPRPPHAVAGPGLGKALGLLIGVGVAAVVLVVGLWLVLKPKAPQTASPETAGPGPAPSTHGQTTDTTGAGHAAVAPAPLIVDALPWAELIEIIDARGGAHPVGPNSYTPLSLELPPGEYKLSLKNPDFPEPLSVSVTVQPGRMNACRAEFRRVDAGEYLKKAGF